MNTQLALELDRVSGRIAAAIVRFCRENRVFRMEALRTHVEAEVGKIAPASCDRVLRDLRAKGKVRYAVLNRRQSMYNVTHVSER